MRTLFFIITLMMFSSIACSVPVDLTFPDGVGAIWTVNKEMGSAGSRYVAVVLAADGNMYELITWHNFPPDYYKWNNVGSLPVPIEEVADWTPKIIVTRSGEVWTSPPVVYDGRYGWRRLNDAGMPPVPWAGIVPGESESLGGLKSLFR